MVQSNNAAGNGISFVNSMRFRIIIAIIACSIICSMIILVTVVPSAQNKLLDATEENMLSIAKGYGAYIDDIQRNMDMTYDVYSQVLDGIGVTGIDSSYVYIVDSDGTMVYHPTQDKVGNKVENACVTGLVSEIKAGKIPEDASVTYDYKGETKMAAYSILTDNYIFVVTADKSEVIAPIKKITRSSLMVELIVIVVMAFCAWLLGKAMSRPIENAADILDRVGEFDFRESEIINKMCNKKDEIGKMARSVKHMCEQIRLSIEEIDSASVNINSNVENLEDITKTINTTCTDNSATTQELAAGMEETTSTSDLIVSNINLMLNEATRIRSLAQEGESNAGEIKVKATELHKKTDKASENTEDMYKQVKENSATALEQAKAVEKINELTKAIMDIADQTNLLSLNASIEAARAGEAGKGFAVVADEIGGLAQESAQTVTSINEIIGEVNNAVKNMAECLNGTIDFLENTVLADYAQFGEVAIQYNNDADGFESSMSEIEKAIEELSNSISDISDEISGINSTISEAAYGVGNIAEKTTDIVAQTSRNEDIVNECAGAVNNLKDIVNKFTL